MAQTSIFEPVGNQPETTFDSVEEVAASTREAWLGVGVPLCEVVYRGPTATVGIAGVEAYPDTFEFTLSVRTSKSISSAYGGLLGRPPAQWKRAARSGKLPDELFRIGVCFKGGLLAVDTNRGLFKSVSGAPRLTQQEGQGSERSINIRYVVVGANALRGQAKVAVEWPAHGIPLRFAALPMRDISSAAKLAKPLLLS